MATGRKQEKPRGRKKPAIPLPEAEADDFALAEQLLRDSRKEHAAVVRESKKFLKWLRLEGMKPIGAKKLREMALREGINPEGNEFSQEIIKMREE